MAAIFGEAKAGGYPHVIYYGDALKHANHNGAGWQIESVDSTQNAGRYRSFALDAGGNPHISYYDHTNFDLRPAFLVRSVIPSVADNDVDGENYSGSSGGGCFISNLTNPFGFAK